MPHETLPTTDQLKYMDDLSAAALYRVEVQRIPFLSREEQADHVTAATAGDTDAAHALVLNCLNWVWRLAYTIHREREPQHTDALDLVGAANVRMLEAVPSALQAADPVPYLMTVASNAMRTHVIYRDPLVTRQRSQTLSRGHPTTVRLEDWNLPQAPAAVVRQNHPIVRAALEQLSSRHRAVLEAAYGLDGGQPMKHEDIAELLNVTKGTVEKYLWRAKRRLAAKLGPYVTELGLQAE